MFPALFTCVNAQAPGKHDDCIGQFYWKIGTGSGAVIVMADEFFQRVLATPGGTARSNSARAGRFRGECWPQSPGGGPAARAELRVLRSPLRSRPLT